MADDRRRSTTSAALASLQHDVRALQQQLWQLSKCVAGQTRRALLADPRFDNPKRLERFGFSVYSQNDEDGCLQEILRRLQIAKPTFVEIGVGDGLENNTHFLLAQGCRGWWIEADAAHCLKINQRFVPQLERQQLALANLFVQSQFVDAILASLSVPREIDVLSIDIDGQDYYVWEALTHTSPRVVVIEYNGKLPPPVALVQPNRPTGTWNGTDAFGASLAALESLGRRKGYNLVGCEISGNNAFFVRSDLVGEHFQPPLTAANHFHPCRYELTCGGAFAVGHPPAATDWHQLDSAGATT